MMKKLRLALVTFLIGVAVAFPIGSYAQSTQICVWCYNYFSPDGRNWCTLEGVDFETQTCSYSCNPLIEGAEVPQDGGPFPYCTLNCRLTETGVICF